MAPGKSYSQASLNRVIKLGFEGLADSEGGKVIGSEDIQ